MPSLCAKPAALALAAGCALSAVAPSASAQNALGEGRTLDSNLRAGSSGYNQVIGSTAGRALDRNLNTLSGGLNGPGGNFGAELAFRNAIVTGNVGGGREFRGSVGYTAADDFRGFLGSNANFQFERDSFYSGLATRNLVGIDAIRNPLAYTVAGQTDSVFGGPLIINRSGVGASASTAAPYATNLRTDVFGNIAGTLRAPSVAITRVDRMPEMLAYSGEPDAAGVRQIMSASPLMGIRSLPSNSPAFSPSDPGSDFVRMGFVQPGPGVIAGDQSVTEEENTNRSPYQLVMQSLRLPAQAKPFGAVPVGSPVSGPNAPDASITPPPPPEGPVPSTIIPPPEDLENPEADSAANPLAPAFDANLEHLRTRLSEAIAERLTADAEGPADENTPQAQEEAAENEESDDEEERTKTAPELAEEILKGKSALIITLAQPPTEGAIYAEHMQRGEQMLRDERWFDAEERFTAALAVRPGDPIAAAARIAAQVAGGMYRSASINLQNLFVAYPEMMVTRFSEDLIGPEKRTGRVKDQLRQRAELDTRIAREATLLLAYVGFQTQDEPTIIEAFNRLDAILAARGESPDEFEQTVRAVWFPASQSPAPAPAPAPAPTP